MMTAIGYCRLSPDGTTTEVSVDWLLQDQPTSYFTYAQIASQFSKVQMDRPAFLTAELTTAAEWGTQQYAELYQAIISLCD